MTANINDYQSWTVTFSTVEERYWGIRFDWAGLGHVLSIGLSSAPAMRIIVLGCSVWFGKIPPRPKTLTTTGGFKNE